MKRCPGCRRDYYDDSLMYCLEDGSALVQGSVTNEPVTAIMSAGGDGTGPQPQSAERSLKSTYRRVIAALVVGIVVLGGVVAYLVWGGDRTTRHTRSTSRTAATQLTAYGGTEADGALSPDGRSFVFLSDHGGTPDLWLRQIAGGDPVRLTNGIEEEGSPIFAADGETIFFTRREGDAEAVWRIGALGGQERRLIGNARMPVPSPDGRRVAYFVPDSDGTGDKLAISALDGSSTSILAENFTGGDLGGRPAWSPDGALLVYNRWALFAPINLFLMDIRTGQERQVTHFSRSGEGVLSAAWLPDDRHLVVSYVPQSTFFQNDLGILDVNDGSIARLTFNIAREFSSLSVSADGSRLVAAAAETRREVWKVPIGNDPEANGRAAVRLVDSSQDPMWTFVSRDGRVLLFNSAITGTRNLWIMPLDRSAPPRQITMVEGDNVMHSALSPDGLRIAFASRSDGNSDIWTQNLDGSELRQLTHDDAADAWPVWSPDGRSIVFASLRDGAWETRQVQAGGGQADKIMDGFFRGDMIRQPTGNGTWLVTTVSKGIRLVDLETRHVVWEEHFERAWSMPMFSPDGRFISVVRPESRDRDSIWLYETATGKGHVAVRFAEPFRLVFRVGWADGGRSLIVNRVQTISHIDLFDRFWMEEESRQ